MAREFLTDEQVKEDEKQKIRNNIFDHACVISSWSVWT